MKSLSVSDKEYICDLQAPCFQILPLDELELIRASKTQVLFKKGDNLTKQGTFASYVLFIFEGLAIQYIESDTLKSFNLRIIKPGEFIGMFS
ncbi:MAG: Crp/Fnr family transcriptional regulator, partial [Chloroflexia bacterium]|nr:Crp/Fnr family transcriptional regulator [Chloroflexia bacterium]